MLRALPLRFQVHSRNRCGASPLAVPVACPFAVRVKVLADGTYPAELAPPRRKDGPPRLVRVIEHTVHTTENGDGDEAASELFCLVTDLLDPQEHPVLDLALPSPATRPNRVSPRTTKSPRMTN